MYIPRFLDAQEDKSRHPTKSGPGRMHVKPIATPDHPAGTKLIRRFIRDARGENISYRKDYLARTGRKSV